MKYRGWMGSNPTPGIMDSTKIPFITTDQVREVDQATIEDYGVSLVQMMENGAAFFRVSPPGAGSW